MHVNTHRNTLFIPILISLVCGPLHPFWPVFSYKKNKKLILKKFTFGPWEFCAWGNVCLTSAPLFSVPFHSTSYLSPSPLSFPGAFVLSLSASCPLLPSAVPPFSFPPLLSVNKYSKKPTSDCYCIACDF